MRFLTILFLLIGQSLQKDFLDVPTNELILRENATENEDLTRDFHFNVLPHVTEEIGVSLDPPSPAIGLSPSILSPGQQMKVIAKDPVALREADDSKFEVIALGLISGNEQRFPLNLKLNNNPETTMTKKDVEDKAEGQGEPKEQKDSSQNLEISSNRPSFEKEIYKIVFDGSIQPIIVKILNYDASRKTKNSLEYRLVGDPEIIKLFKAELRDDSFVISMRDCENCVLPFKFSFGLMAREMSSKTGLSAIFSFRNEKAESLHFSQKIYSTSLLEGSRSLARLIKLRSFGSKAENVTYSLENSNGIFSLDHKTGILSIQHPEFISRQSLGSQLRLTTHLTSGSFKDSATILVDIIGRDELTESQPIVEKVESKLSLSAEVPEISLFTPGRRKVKYSISEGDTEKFSIEKGTLHYTGPFKPNPVIYKLKILIETVHDGEKRVEEMNLEVKVEGSRSFPPDFLSNDSMIKLLESDTTSTLTLKELTLQDLDEDADLELSVHSVIGVEADGTQKPFPSNFFDISREKVDEIVLKPLTPLNALNVSVLRLQLRATDLTHLNEPKAYANVTLLLYSEKPKIDKNRMNRFNSIPSIISIDQSTPIGTYLFTVSSMGCQERQEKEKEERQERQEKEGKDSFSLSKQSTCFFALNPSNESSILSDFRVNPTTGEITTRKRFDEAKTYHLSIEMRNRATRMEKNVSMIVRVNPTSPKPPSFSNVSYTATMLESERNGAKILQVQLNDLTNRHHLKLIGELAEHFEIDRQGIVKLAKEIDAEQIESFELFATIRDEAKTLAVALIEIHVNDENDNAPKFSEQAYFVEIFDDIPLGSEIIQIKASDGDSDALKYSMKCDCDEKEVDTFFKIDDEKGHVTIMKYPNESMNNRTYSVKASDGLHETFTKLEISWKKSTKCIPEFDPKTVKEFHIKQSTTKDETIGRIEHKAMDKRCEVFYSLREAKTKKTPNRSEFEIHPKSGEFFVKNFSNDSNEKRKTLIITMKSGDLEREMGIDVVLDGDDEFFTLVASNLTFLVPEDLPIGSLIGRVPIKRSSETNKGLNFSIIDSKNGFTVNETTGDIRLKKPLDAEDRQSHNFTIEINNQELIQATVYSKDVNDNGPVFPRREYSLSVHKDALPGTLLITLRAHDPDTNNAMHYRILSSTFVLSDHEKEGDDIFTLNSTTGELRVESFSLNEFDGGAFYIQVEASDGVEDRSHKDVTTIKIYVHNDESVLVMEMNKSPLEVFWKETDQIIESISRRTGLQGIPLVVAVHRVESHPIAHNSDLMFVMVNASSLSVVPAKEALSVIDAKKWRLGDGSVVRSLQAVPSPLSIRSSSIFDFLTTPIALLLTIFAILLLIILVVILVLICYYRGRFLKEQELFQGRQVLAQTLTRPKISPVPLNLVFDGLYDRNNPSLFQSTEYSIQEVKMNVEAEKGNDFCDVDDGNDGNDVYGVVDKEKKSPRPINQHKNHKNRDYATIYEPL